MTEKNVVGMYNIKDEYPVFQHENPDEKRVDPVSYESTPLNRVAGIRGATSSMDPISQWRKFSERLRERREQQQKIQNQTRLAEQKQRSETADDQNFVLSNFQENYERSALQISTQAQLPAQQSEWLQKYQQQKLASEEKTEPEFLFPESSPSKPVEIDAGSFAQPVKNVMTRRVLCALESTPVERVADICVRRGISGLPIVNAKQQLVGIITLSDLLRELFSKEVVSHFIDSLSPVLEQRLLSVLEEPVSHYMQHEVLTVSPQSSVIEVCQKMEEHKVRRVIVARDRHIRGVFSARDAVQMIAAA